MGIDWKKDLPHIPEPKADSLEFPNIMKGLAGDFAGVYAEHLESPQHFFFISFLVCLGSLFSGKLTIASEIKPQPILYVLLLGESADDRKSTAINKTIDFFKFSVNRFPYCLGVNSAEGLQIILKSEVLLTFSW